MHFTEIRLINFGQYNGEHVIDFRLRDDASELTDRPIFLIGGKNGAGKTTLLEAVKLCLYGSAFLGPGAKAHAYESFLISRIHRQLGAPLQNIFAGIEVAFVHTISGVSHAFHVRRMWQRKGRGADETLTVVRNGIVLTTEEYAWWEQFLHDLLPPGLADLFFFDGEKIQALAEDTDFTALGQAIRALLGLDLLDRLRADLAIYTTRQKRSGEANLEKQLQSLFEARKHLEDEFGGAYALLNEINTRLSHKAGKVEEDERLLASEGGTLATRRDELKLKAEVLRSDITRYEHAIAEQANGLLPFAVIPNLCRDLSNRLMLEEQAEQSMAVQVISESFVQKLLGRVIQDDTWLKGSGVGPEDRVTIVGGLTAVIQQVRQESGIVDNELEPTAMLHDISKRDRQELLSWATQAATALPETMQSLGAGLDVATNELSAIEASLLRMPAEEVVQPILQRLATFHQEIGRLEAEKVAQETVVNKLRLQRADLERGEQELYKRMMRGDDPSYRIKLASQSQQAIIKYEELLRRNKIHELEKRIVECFSRLSRKGNYVRQVSIDPKTFETLLFNQKGDPLPKEQLSAGEKQIYAIAVLWALRLVSGRSVPIIVDTPLGRLDSEHRERLVQRYFPQASHQVILLSTDTEIDEELYSELKPAIAREYHLTYENRDATTRITEGYFWDGAEAPMEEEVVA